MLLDVRGAGDWPEDHLAGATHIMLSHLPDRLRELPTDKPIILSFRLSLPYWGRHFTSQRHQQPPQSGRRAERLASGRATGGT